MIRRYSRRSSVKQSKAKLLSFEFSFTYLRFCSPQSNLTVVHVGLGTLWSVTVGHGCKFCMSRSTRYLVVSLKFSLFPVDN